MTSPDSEPLRKRILFQLAVWLGPWLIRALGKLCRYRVSGEQGLWDAVQADRGAILALWHGRMLLPVYHFRNRGICALVSLHRDGEMITRVVHKLGYTTRRGSPKEGGREGFNGMVRDIRKGRVVAIFPDGPTGPRHVLKDGVLHLARITGAAVVPMSYSAKPNWTFGSWDKFRVMKPFSRGRIILGSPIYVPRRLSEEEVAKQREILTEALTQVEQEADEAMGT